MTSEKRRGGLVPPIGLALLMAISVLADPGCGPANDHVACHPVSGQVLVGDQPADGVLVKFYNAKNPKDVDAPQPYATTDAAGNFSMSTFDPGDGAPADDYIVIILWPEGPPGPGAPKDRLGNAFTNPDTTPYRATVKPGENKLEPFKIPADALKKGSRKGSAPPDDPSLPPR